MSSSSGKLFGEDDAVSMEALEQQLADLSVDLDESIRLRNEAQQAYLTLNETVQKLYRQQTELVELRNRIKGACHD